ncbi:hypothetical protein OSB04_005446 [Centaurea solstitialis]|uniref:Uncharacterized protein n=1 Tax=Centaurea solstitialis TaxID=347529 RepID=A0AA38WS40_9ASTR|nr:hypothetical protein OSB04_005446 [Centaurea solstitialis]
MAKQFKDIAFARILHNEKNVRELRSPSTNKGRVNRSDSIEDRIARSQKVPALSNAVGIGSYDPEPELTIRACKDKNDLS